MTRGNWTASFEAAESFDYVIVGGGTAGCVLANRLSSDSRSTVLLLEAGRTDRHLNLHIPAAFPMLFKSHLDWGYYTTAQQAIDNRRIYWPRGKVLGGSSSTNAMMWVRGFRADYDAWADLVGPMWSYESILPYFRRAEDSHLLGGIDELHGSGGPIPVSFQRSMNPLTRSWLAACGEFGIAFNQDRNGGEELGVAPVMVTQRRGRRSSGVDAYLAPARRRHNLVVRVETHVEHVEFDGRSATGVTYRMGRGEAITVGARREVILSAGTINTPQILMCSGIGDAERLSSFGIATVAHNKEVGANLMDHLTAGIAVESMRELSLARARSPRSIAKYVLFRRGLLTSNIAEGYGFIRSDESLGVADLELLFTPAAFTNEGLTIEKRHGITLGAVLLRPKSRGRVDLATSDPLVAPLIDPRYMTDPEGHDEAVLRRGVRICQEILEMPSLKDEIGEFIQPAGLSGEELIDSSVNRYSQTLYHPVGTCRMGSDADSVVDENLLVRNTLGLRIVDGSVMPTMIRGHTNAAVVMIAEKAADVIGATS